MLRASTTYSDLFQSLFESKFGKMGFKWDGAEPDWDIEQKMFLDREIGKEIC